MQGSDGNQTLLNNRPVDTPDRDINNITSVVGEDNVYEAQTTEEIDQAVESIIDEDVVSIERNKNEFFKKLGIGSWIGFSAWGLSKVLGKAGIRLPKRRNK